MIFAEPVRASLFVFAAFSCLSCLSALPAAAQETVPPATPVPVVPAPLSPAQNTIIRSVVVEGNPRPCRACGR